MLHAIIYSLSRPVSRIQQCSSKVTGTSTIVAFFQNLSVKSTYTCPKRRIFPVQRRQDIIRLNPPFSKKGKSTLQQLNFTEIEVYCKRGWYLPPPTNKLNATHHFPNSFFTTQAVHILHEGCARIVQVIILHLLLSFFLVISTRCGNKSGTANLFRQETHQ